MRTVPSSPWPEVPGFVVLPRASEDGGEGRDPDLVPAVEEGTRRRVLLRRLPELDESDRARMAAALTPVDALTSDDLGAAARLHRSRDLLVLPDPGRTLADDAVAPRSTGQLVTALVPVASALADLHEAGLAHGRVVEGLVEVDNEGRPRLVGAGEQAALHALVPREVPAPTAEDDRAALQRLALRLAERVNDPTPAEVLTSPENAHASAREVAGLLLDLADPVPLDRPAEALRAASDPPDADPAPSRRLDWRWLALVAAAVVVVVGGIAWWAARSDDTSVADGDRSTLPQPADPVPSRTADSQSGATESPAPDESPAPGEPPTASGQPTTDAEAELAAQTGVALCGAPPPAPESAPPRPDDWAEVVAELYVRRSAALVTGQTSLLCDVYDPLSPGLADDLALEAAYQEQDLRPDGLDFVVESAEQVERTGALVLVEVTDRLEPYLLLGPDGDVAAELPGIETGTWQARLVPDATGTEWRFG